MSTTLFISYSHKNRVLVDRLRRELTALGAVIWADHLRLKPGTPDWEDAIRVGIQASDALIYVASPDARESRVVRGELAVADLFKRTVIPFWVDGDHWADAAPLKVVPTQYVDARGPRFDEALTQLAATCGLYGPALPASLSTSSTRLEAQTEFAETKGAGLTRRQLVVGGIATVATIAGLGTVLSRMESGAAVGHQQATAPPRRPGQLLWKYKITGILGTMAADAKYLYVTSADSNLHAFDISSGKIAWTFSTGLGSNTAQLPGTAISDGVVYFGVSDGGRSDFIALDAATRKLRWRLSFDDYNKRWTGTPAVVGGVVYFGDEQGYLYAARVSDGSIVWRFASADPRTFIQGDYTNTPVIAGGKVYVGRGDNILHALDAATGRELWHFTAGDIILAPPAVVETGVYVASTDTTLTALDAGSGTRAWQFGVGESVGNGAWSPPMAANGVVYVADIFNALYAVDAVTGDEVWHADVTFGTGPVVTNKTVYIGDGHGVRVRAYDARFGAQLWQCPTDVPNSEASPDQINAQYTTPTVSNGVLYISSITDPSTTNNPSTTDNDASTIYAVTA